MPVLILLMAVILAAALTVALAYVFGLGFSWLSVATLVAALAGRRWA